MADTKQNSSIGFGTLLLAAGMCVLLYNCKSIWNHLFTTGSNAGNSANVAPDSGPIDAGATRAFWTDVRPLALPLRESPSAAEAVAAAEQLDRLNVTGVDPKLVQFSRDMSALYRKYARGLNEAEERGRKGEGLDPTFIDAQSRSVAEDSNQLADRFVEIQHYIQDTYHY